MGSKVNNYPRTQNISEQERNKRLKYNRAILFKEVYVPNERLEELIGMKMTTNKPCVKNVLSDSDINECIDLVLQEIDTIYEFGRMMKVKHNNNFNEWCGSPKWQAYAKMERERELGIDPTIDKNLYSVSRMKEVYIEAKEKVEKIYKNSKMVKVVTADTTEGRLSSLNQMLFIQPFMDMIFIGLSMKMIYMRVNFHGASVPLFDMY